MPQRSVKGGGVPSGAARGTRKPASLPVAKTARRASVPRSATYTMTKVDVDPELRAELDAVVSSMCKALNDPKRLLALYALRDGPLTVTEISHALAIPQANTSQHLAVLRERGLVHAKRDHNRVVYSLRYPGVLDAVDMLRDVMAEEVAWQHATHANRRTRASG